MTIIVHPPAEDDIPNPLVFEFHPEPLERDAQAPFASLDGALSQLRSETHSAPLHRSGRDSAVLSNRQSSTDGDIGDETVRMGDVGDETIRDDIVEIVKVRRGAPEPEEAPKPKPKSLRSRAGSAFRSIKNLALARTRSGSNSSSTSNNKPYAHEVFASSQSTQATFATMPSAGPNSPPLSRRGSMILTDLFRAPSSTHRYEPEETDYDDYDGPNIDRESIVRAPSPSQSSRKLSSIARRLSIISFRKPSSPRPSSPPTLSRDSTVPSTSSSSAPQTPTDETYPQAPPSPKDVAEDDGGEMRLDSLHFEALSFDADQF
ncbi:hypothetical protein HMN09_00056800 [Mycena chlorophos]|uniref:Uncharacterized protein n=1 Tax=Mycena chlorophos TaxID=658473 RepID=A0A8H6TPD6_MYCCL|nr:hypothetical protein HMN09_00056800 [Mycena chlorophos]